MAAALGVEQPELALDDLKARFRGELLRPGDPSYDQARRVWNAAIDRYPALIARCSGTADVIAAVNFARGRNLVVAIRFAGCNGALACTKYGVIPSLARRSEVDRLFSMHSASLP